MSGILTPGERTGQWDVAGDLTRRVRALEAVQPCCDDSGGAFATYRDCVLANSPVAYFPLDETSGDAIDVIEGTVLTASTYTTFPTYAQAGPFPGAPDNTSILFGGPEGTGIFGGNDRFSGNATSNQTDIFGAGAEFTIEAWVYFVAYASVAERRIFQNWSQIPATNIFQIGSDTTGHITVSKGTENLTSPDPVSLNAWTHVRVTFDGTDMRLYINTEEVTSIAAPDLINGGPWVIGNTENASNVWRPFSGRISDLAAYATALTEFCDTVGPDGPTEGSGNAESGMVRTADGAGGTAWAFPTVAVDDPAGRYDTINLGDGLTGTDEGDGSVTIDASGGIPATILDAKGDLISATAADTPARVAVGTDGRVLTADSGAAAGVSWQTPDPADDTSVWMPLTTVMGGVPELVWEADDSLIPTLVPL